MASAAEAYRERLELQRRRLVQATARDLQLGLAKIAGVVALIVVGWLAAVDHRIPDVWIVAPVAALVALFLIHDRVLQERGGSQRLTAYYQHLLARAADQWAGQGEPGDRFRDLDHPYAADLDLFGRGSLFELLCTARTQLGQEKLAGWLREFATSEEIRRRQERVAALRDHLDLREQVARLGDKLDHVLDSRRFAAWAGAEPRLRSGAARWGWLLVAAISVGLGLYGAATLNLGPFFLWVVMQAVVVESRKRHWEPALADRGANGEGLRLTAGILTLLPQQQPQPLRQLARLADWIEADGTLLGRILDAIVLYRVHLAYAADAWRRRHGAQVAAWLDAVGEFEALLSLASYAYERPQDPFPEVLATDLPMFDGTELGHPLIPTAGCVRNSVRLDERTRLLLISGSNMSGKSTMLRTVGLSVVMAGMGAPVRAARLQLTRTMLGTRLRTSDSLQLGRSGFYAEILRLRQIYELTNGPLPLLYLFDEIFEGTNSHDRVIGADGLVRALLDRRTLGMITTHDLALTRIAEHDPRVRNMHFEDQIEGDDVRFDHQLRDGVVTRSNALALMRIIGLAVDSGVAGDATSDAASR